ncbi:phage tail length tape measure family protein [Brevundimonas faecalis]|uniref:Phage-related minor tail protein n=1 Tax=Brevundimonas faecalis TaxID=947378 RepID=A0ABV2RCC9_9CAUL
MSVKQIAVRLKPEGGKDVVREAQGAERALVSMNEKAAAGSDRAAAAARREIEQLREVAKAAVQAQTAAQNRINAVAGGSTRISLQDQTSAPGNARASVAAQSLFAADKVYERRAQALRAALDPAWAAQQKLNQELAEYDALAKRGKITTDQLAQAQGQARRRYEEATLALDRQNKGMTRNVLASRLNLTRQASDVFTTGMMGMNPFMIAIQQGPQIMDAFATSAIRLTGPLTLLVGSLGLAAGATAVLGAAWHNADKSAAALENAATGLGRTARLTATELKAAADAGAEAGEVSIRAAEKMAATYVSTGKIGGEVMSGLIAITKDYAVFAGKDAVGATEYLAKAMEDPAKAGAEMTRQFGLLDMKTLEHIESLQKLGDRTAAQKLLLEALTGAMSGHADQVDELSSFWDVATRSMSNYWTKLGEWLHTTDSERIAELEARVANRSVGVGGGRAQDPTSRRRDEAELFRLRYERDWNSRTARDRAAEAARNQAAIEARDRNNAGKKDRDSAARSAARAAREAEREAREALQRRRREEDTQAAREREIARATNDHGETRRLEEEERIRRRVRELEDGGAKSAEARTKALEEDAPLRQALADAAARERGELMQAAQLDVMRAAGREQDVAAEERVLDLRRRTEEYRKAGLGTIAKVVKGSLDIKIIDEAAGQAGKDRLAIDQARLQVVQRLREEAALEHRLTLARLSGDTQLARILNTGARIRSRAREIEQREGWNRGDDRAMAQAKKEIVDEINAEIAGARRQWMSNFLLDIKHSGIGDAIGEQFDRATDKWIVKLGEALADLAGKVDWSQVINDLFGGGKGMGGKGGASGGGWASVVGDIMNSVFGSGHSAGTDFSEGGLKWVGERGPELLRLPRGSGVYEHNRSRQIASAAAAPMINFGGLTVNNMGSEPLTGSMRQTPDGGMELLLEPVFKAQLQKAGRNGDLMRGMKATPQPRRRG